MFRIHMLPAAHGDCLWIEYGTSPADVHRVLRCTSVSSASRNRVAPQDLLGALEQFTRRLERSTTNGIGVLKISVPPTPVSLPSVYCSVPLAQ